MTIERKQVPSLGRIVHVLGKYVSLEHPGRAFPAIITQVWSETSIDVQIFGEEVSKPFHMSVPFESNPEGVPAPIVWRWPPYVTDRGAAVSLTKTGSLDVSVPVAPSSYLDRLIMELSELTERRQKLGKFFSHPDFVALSAENKTLLDQQQVVMDSYIRILDRRISLAEKT